MNASDYLKRLGIAGGRTKEELKAAIAGFSDKSDTRCQSFAVELAMVEMAEAANAECLETRRELAAVKAEVTRLKVELQLVRRGADDARTLSDSVYALGGAIRPLLSEEAGIDLATLVLRDRAGLVFISASVGAVLDARAALYKAMEAVK